MPTAAPMMPPSETGVSNTRDVPYFFSRPSLHRTPPPKYPTSWPNTTTLLSRSSMTSIAERSACTMVIDVVAMASFPPRSRSHSELLALLAKVLRHIPVDVFEYRGGACSATVDQSPVARSGGDTSALQSTPA